MRRRRSPVKLLRRDANVFVLGDLLIDHTVFVEPMRDYPAPVSGESSFRVKRRIDTAGGAATTARAIANLTSGTTILWGLVGDSPWGTFRSILEKSQALDRAANNIELRGARDETHAPMTTISRLVEVATSSERGETYTRRARFSDFGHIHIPVERQRSAVHHHLTRVHAKTPLDYLVLNDLDFGALGRDVVAAVSDFALEHSLPLLVRARRSGEKFRQLPVDTLVCTLTEWVELVGGPATVDFGKNLLKPDIAVEFGRRTLDAFRETRRFVVLDGDEWIDQIIMLERPTAADQTCRLAIAPGLPKDEKGRSHQAGASDVFVGAVVLALSGSNAPDIDAAVDAARLVCQAYQKSRFHHVPTISSVEAETVGVPAAGFQAIHVGQIGTPFLPDTREFRLADAETKIEGILSVTAEMRRAVDGFLHDVLEGTRSIVLEASGGSGKTAIADAVHKAQLASGRSCFTVDQIGVPFSWERPHQTIQDLQRACTEAGSPDPLIIVDEALKRGRGRQVVSSEGVVLLDEAKKRDLRFIFVDADFGKLDRASLQSQFGRRVAWHRIPPSWERPKDIPYAFADMLRRSLPDRQVSNLELETSALLAIIEAMLATRSSFGDLFEWSKEIARSLTPAGPRIVRFDDLTDAIRAGKGPYRSSAQRTYIAMLKD